MKCLVEWNVVCIFASCLYKSSILQTHHVTQSSPTFFFVWFFVLISTSLLFFYYIYFILYQQFVCFALSYPFCIALKTLLYTGTHYWIVCVESSLAAKQLELVARYTTQEPDEKPRRTMSSLGSHPHPTGRLPLKTSGGASNLLLVAL